MKKICSDPMRRCFPDAARNKCSGATVPGNVRKYKPARSEAPFGGCAGQLAERSYGAENLECDNLHSMGGLHQRRTRG